MVSHARTWRAVWTDAAYAPDGFWSRPHPTRHFRTAAATSPLLAQRILELVSEQGPLGRIDAIVDVGAGEGRLLDDLHGLAPWLRLAGIDQLPRPARLPAQVAWWQDRWDTVTGTWTTGAADSALAGLTGSALLIMCEWLDDLPAPLAVRRGRAWHELCADAPPDGSGDGTGSSVACRCPALPVAEERWARRWCGAGRVCVIGSTRDQAWRWAVRAVPAGGLVVAVDYGHRRGEDDGGLRGYLSGREVEPDPARPMNLTAGVAMDSLVITGEQAGARTVVLARQSAMLADSGPEQRSGVTSQDSLTRLVRRAEHTRLVDPRGWGGHWWLVQAVPARRATSGSPCDG